MKLSKDTEQRNMRTRQTQNFLAKICVYCAGLVLLLVFGVITPGLSKAQSVSDLSPSQRQRLQNLPQDQRQELLEQYRQEQQSEEQEREREAREEVIKRREEISQKARQQYEQPSPIEQRLRQRLQAPTAAEGQAPSSLEQDLRQFGYDLFRGPPSTFAPLTQIPMPAGHVIGPGDTIKVQLYGKKNARYSLKVDRNGQIDFPEIGPLNVGGQSFEEVKELIQQQVKNQFIGVETSVTLGELRSIRVFILGDVVAPGSYTVSSLSSLTNALLASGGVKRIGSLRDITLKRDGEIVTELDLYRLLLEGDTSQDVRLRPGDVIHVPPVGPTVGIVGEVLRPAIYELDDSATVGELIDLAGGLNPSADRAHVQINRRTPSGTQTVEDLNLEHEEAWQKSVRNGDVLQIYDAPEQAQNVVFLQGHFKRPGSKEWRPGMRLTDVVTSVKEDLLSTPDLDYAIIKREVGPRRRTKVLSVDLGAALSNPDSDANIRIQPRDTLYVFNEAEKETSTKRRDDGKTKDTAQSDTQSIREMAANAGITRAMIQERSTQEGISFKEAARQLLLEEGFSEEELEQARREQEADQEGRDEEAQREIPTRRALIDPVIKELYQQAKKGHPAQVVQVEGRIRVPGEYPLEKDMRVSDLIRAGNGLEESAYSLKAELTRYTVRDGEYREVSHHSIDLAAIYKGDAEADLKLQPHDRLYIQKLPQWEEPARIELRGEVRFPGNYSLSKGDTLTEVLERAGGLTQRAYPEGAVFIREELQEKEQERLDRMTQRLQNDLAKISLAEIQQDPKAAQGYTALQNMLDQLRSTEAVGRLTLDLPAILADKAQDIRLSDGDELHIPSKPQEVTVMGEVQFTTSHLYREGLDYEDYIQKCGGATARADENRIYVIHANGEVERPGSGWFSVSAPIKPGDTIVVPLNVDYIKPLDLASNVSQIVYQLGLAAASWVTVSGI